MDLCRRTAGLAHPLPVSQVGSNNIQVRLHYIDGNYTVLPEVVEAALGPHMQVLQFFLITTPTSQLCLSGQIIALAEHYSNNMIMLCQLWI